MNWRWLVVLGLLGLGLSFQQQCLKAVEHPTSPLSQDQSLGDCQRPQPSALNSRASLGPNFLVLAGGGAPSYNEVALEKNVLYFQRTLRHLGFNPSDADIFFANGSDGQASVRYVDQQGRERFRAPQIPELDGASTRANLQRGLQQAVQQPGSLFLYFTGHGGLNRQNPENNSLYLWGDQELSVRELAGLLDRLPQQTPVIAVMAQCFSGSFANLIYQGGNPSSSVALQTRCGFFATIKTQPSVGCTPEVNEADYRDYSSSFFAGLSGRSRTGEPVTSADYNDDRRVSYAEAHAFAKVDEQTTDLPVSTSEVWLQRQGTERERQAILNQPIASLVQAARPEQAYVLRSLSSGFGLDSRQSFTDNLQKLNRQKISTEVQRARLTRLQMELLNVGLAQKIRRTGTQTQKATLEQLTRCEGQSWAGPAARVSTLPHN
ncbi:caspase family protein [Leptolyngbya sp. FACHB-261]|uniref:caspase family protein n=1 Tax=Leptolyngbya sp. FACHB-261 TaxID=2692806 RepID=UPI001686298B|nr:caspase family protein [Leptolyngbya sp. FACHB-261]MBD2102953.1 caspase family protein [Leptolyngbya sp. FACHB-261]